MLAINLLWLLLAPLFSSSTAAATAKQGCEENCGDLIVPYPFGIGLGKNCSIGSLFDVNCDTSFNPPKPFLANGYLEIVNISSDKLRVKNWVAMKCYTETGNISNRYSLSLNLTGTPYSLADSNKFTLVGCDDQLVFSGASDRSFRSGCLSLCSERELFIDGLCTGIGCCQTSIPKGLQSITYSLGSFYNHTNISSFNPCGYAFLGEQDVFKFRKSDFSDESFRNRTTENVPIVIDWAIGNQNCSDAKKSTEYACLQNSDCVDSDTGLGGYHCSCSTGYEGNPYLSPGCTDIDECKNNPCNKNGICTNIPGGFKCSCKDGFSGDGTKNGTRCIDQNAQIPVISKILLVVGASIGLLLLLTVGSRLYKAVKKRQKQKHKQKFFKRNGGLLLQQQLSTNEGLIEKTRLFTDKELLKATDQFNESRILGRGGQGTVYKGMISDGRTVAVKKSKLVGENQLGSFINELVILSQINHRNVVKLLGCCLETEVPMLVYEFLPNRTLFDYIHDESDDFLMTWDIRLRIAAEIAGALAYLHYENSHPIYHRDIKSSNILLDENYKAKVSDFGISRSVSIDQTHLTTLVKGTFGYFDPEYFQSNQFTDKSDVYSFGVVLVELLSGQKPVSSNVAEDERSLVKRFLTSVDQNCLIQILDPKLSEHFKDEEIIHFANIARRCLNLDGSRRPTMKEVAMELEGLRKFTRHPWNQQRNAEENIALLSEQSDLDLYDITMAGQEFTSSGQDSLHTDLIFPSDNPR